MIRSQADGDAEPSHQQAAAASVEVALATYNSEPFLSALLDSLFAQTNQAFTLIVSDDRSTDATLEILDRYASLHPGRIRLLPHHDEPLGPLGNFARLLDHATGDYLLLCDHDDVWLPNKIALSVESIQALEAEHRTNTPLLVHTDLIVAGPDLEVISPSLIRYAHIDPARNDLISLLTANVATGCATIVNRSLYERARPVPREAMMHDHWLALVAAALGAIAYVDQPTILYRQHGGNAIGAQKPGTATLIHRIRQTVFSDVRRRVMLRYSRNAAALLSRFGAEMRPHHRRATETLANLWSSSRWRRFALLRRSGLGMRGFVRNAALLVVVTRRGPIEPES